MVNKMVGRLEKLRDGLSEKGTRVIWDCMCGPPTPLRCYEDLVNLYLW